ncbi:hypothetical protein ACHQM5_017219 [Ranunculus cassubicifolius]
MEVEGRHALLFDDDASSAFVNSREALVDWNSLLIDRYDVRHLLHSLPPNLPKRRRQSEEIELDHIRYQDLPSPNDDDVHQSHDQQEIAGAEAADGNTYGAVSFSYGNTDVSSEGKNIDGSGFLPPFSVPQSLLQSLPPTEKLHQIMARTAIYVSEHGSQSEIVLRVKQGNNPTFGFLMPDHQLHAYFRFLVDHPDVLKSDSSDKADAYMKTEKEQKQTAVVGEALSLLGSVYGYEEDEDGADSRFSESDKATDRKKASSGSLDHESELSVLSGSSTRVHLAAAGKNSHPADKENLSESKKILSANATTGTSGLSKKKEGVDLQSHPGSSKLSQVYTQSRASKGDPLIVEPPFEIKRTMDKIVEFILRNGKEFEAVLIEQDRTNGRFPFLRPSNLYHSYYLKLIEESKQGGKQSSLLKDIDTSSNGYSSHDLEHDPDQKEKFRMVITTSKKDDQEPTASPKQSSQQHQYGMSVDTVAAILQAATGRGPRTKAPLVEQGIGSDDSSLGTLSPSAIGLSDVSVSKKRDLASEADSSEVGVGLTKEQKLKAERLKRAKMFAAIIKSGGTVASPQANDAEPPETGTKDSGSLEIITREREGSSVAVGSPDKHRKLDSEDNKERRSGKRHHYRSRTRVDDDEDEEKHSRKKHRSRHVSSHRDENRRRRHSSSKDRESQHYRRRYHGSSSSEDERHHHKSSRSSSIRPSRERKTEPETSRGMDSSTTPAAQPPTGVTEISDDLRAKVRAMLLATM